ncbi:MAG: hypothetical protein ACYDH8_04815 [Syntrophales bacterium]
MALISIPLDHSDWVIPGQLLARFFTESKYPAQKSAKMEGLINAGIRHIINLMEEGELDHRGPLCNDFMLGGKNKIDWCYLILYCPTVTREAASL